LRRAFQVPLLRRRKEIWHHEHQSQLQRSWRRGSESDHTLFIRKRVTQRTVPPKREYLLVSNNPCHFVERRMCSQNLFQGEDDVVPFFTSAINSSRLTKLVLSTHASLSDTFVSSFLPSLDSPHLRELHLSMVGLTRKSLPYITSYIESRRSHPLNLLKLNGNRLGYRSLGKIIQTIECHNFSLVNLEVYGNRSSDGPTSGSSSNDEGNSLWSSIQADLTRLLLRNNHLKNMVEHQALTLLWCARPILLRSSRPSLSVNTSPAHSKLSAPTGSQDITSQEKCDLPAQNQHKSAPCLPTLPVELQLYILSFIAPCLSTAQRLRVFSYCSNPSTLPQLFPRRGDAFLRNDEASIANFIEEVGCNYYEEG
jgi:hypothetical protein